MRKKTLLVLSVATMCILFTGCGKKEKVTANELLENPFGKGEIESMDADANIDLTISLDMSTLMGEFSEDGELYEDTSVENDTIEGLDQSDPTGFDLEETEDSFALDIKFSIDAKIKTDNDTSYLKGDITYDIFGMSETMTEETYIQKDEDSKTTYDYDADYEEWYKVTEDIEENTEENTEDYKAILDMLSIELFTDCEAKSTKDGYDVTGVASVDKIVELALDGSETEEEVTELINEVKKYDFNVTIKFNKDKVIKEIIVECKKNNEEKLSLDIKEFNFNIVFNGINNVDVSVPDEVLENAISNDFDDYYDNTTEEYDIDDSDVEANVMAYEIFGETTITSYDIIDAISKTYMEMPDDDIITAMVNMVNSYTVEKFTKNLASFNQWNEDNKMAVVYYYGLGVFTIDDLEKFGADRYYILEEYDNIHNVDN